MKKDIIPAFIGMNWTLHSTSDIMKNDGEIKIINSVENSMFIYIELGGGDILT